MLVSRKAEGVADLVVRFRDVAGRVAVDVDAPSIVMFASNGGIPAPEALLLEPKLRAGRRRLLLDECTRDPTQERPTSLAKLSSPSE